MLYVLYALVVIVLAVVLMPKPPAQKPPALTDLTAPTVKQGKPVAKVFGRKIVSGTSIVWYGDLAYNDVRAKGGK